MSQYQSSSRSSEFAVLNADRLRALVDDLVCDEDDITLETVRTDAGDKYRIRANGCIEIDPDADIYDDYDVDDYDHRLMPFVHELQKLLPEGELFTFIEAGFDGSRDVGSFGIVATRDKVETVDMEDLLSTKGNAMFGRDMSALPPLAPLSPDGPGLTRDFLADVTKAMTPFVPPVTECGKVPRGTELWTKTVFVWITCPGEGDVICPRCWIGRVKLYPCTDIIPAPLKDELVTRAPWFEDQCKGYEFSDCRMNVDDHGHARKLFCQLMNSAIGKNSSYTIVTERYVKAVFRDWLRISS